MPNTPARLGKGMTVWYATPETTEEQRAQAAALLGALGAPARGRRREDGRDGDRGLAAPARPTSSWSWRRSSTRPSTSASRATSPTTSSSRRSRARRSSPSSPGCTRPSCATWSPRPAARRAAALHELESGRLRTVLSEAVWAAYRRTVELGDQLEASVGAEAERRSGGRRRRPTRTRASASRPPVDLRRRRSPSSAAVDLRAPEPRLLGRRGGPLGSPASRPGPASTTRPGALPGRRAVRRRRAGLVARRARRAPRRLAGARRSTTRRTRDRDRPLAVATTTYDGGDFDTFNERRREPWAVAAERRDRSARLAASRARLLAPGAPPVAPRHPRRRRRGAGSTWCSTATTSTTSASSSRGPAALRARQVDGDPFVADPRAPDRGRFWPGRDDLATHSRRAARRWSRSTAGTTVEVTPGWTLRDHVAHLADWADGGRPRDRGPPARTGLAGRPRRGHRRLERAHGRARRATEPDPWRPWPGTSAAEPRCTTPSPALSLDGAPLAGRLVMGVRLPPRACPQAPGAPWAVVR